MTFSLEKTIDLLERTPKVLRNLLEDVSSDWTRQHEGGETWSVYDVVGHLIHGEQTDWMVRATLILSDKDDKTFTPFDRFAQFNASKGKDLTQLLEEFSVLRYQNLRTLNVLQLSPEDLTKTGIHPDFGEVSLTQLLATWVVHYLNHLNQINRIMAKQYQQEVGPWSAYLNILI